MSAKLDINHQISVAKVQLTGLYWVDNWVFSEYALKEESECQKCEYKTFCNGGCVGMSYHYFGELGMGDKRCPKLHK